MFSSLRFFSLLCGCLLFLSACAPHRQYMAVAPGMTQREVRETIPERPTAFFDHGQGYVTWQYGDKYCVVFKDDAVVSKNIFTETADRKGKKTTARAAFCPLPR